MYFYEDTAENKAKVYRVKFGSYTIPDSCTRWFQDMKSLQSIDWDNFDPRCCRYATKMFQYCGLLTIDLSNQLWLNLLDTGQMFYGSTAVKIVAPITSERLTQAYQMFRNTVNLEDLDISGLCTGGVLNFSDMFRNSAVEKIDVSTLDTGRGINFSYMFSDCGNLVDLIGIQKFDMSNAENVQYMFSQCSKLVLGSKLGVWRSNVEGVRIARMFQDLPDQGEVFDMPKFKISDKMFASIIRARIVYLDNVDTSLLTDISGVYVHRIYADEIQLGGTFQDIQDPSDAPAPVFPQLRKYDGSVGPKLCSWTSTNVKILPNYKQIFGSGTEITVPVRNGTAISDVSINVDSYIGTGQGKHMYHSGDTPDNFGWLYSSWR